MARKTLRYYYELLERSLGNLEHAYAEAESSDSVPRQELARDATVQRFEIAYELLIKLMFKVADRLPEPESRERRLNWVEAHRTWRELGITKLAESDYNNFKKIRNQTTHTYQEDIYSELVEPILRTFIEELLYVTKSLKSYIPNE